MNIYKKQKLKRKHMFIVKVGDKISIDRALKILKNKMVKTGLLKELRSREQFLKKSEVRREEIKNAIYIQRLRDEELKNE